MRHLNRQFPPLSGLVFMLCVISACTCPAMAASLPDPTRPPARSNEPKQVQDVHPAAPNWTVDSILISGSRRLAIVNGRVTRVGETVSGARIAAITPREVLLEYQGREFRVRIVPGDISSRTGQGATRKGVK